MTNNRDLGPWLTISGNPETTIDINWLTENRIRTRILFGTDPQELREYEGSSGREKLHTLSLIDLEPGKEYFYSIDDEIYSFQTASPSGDNYSISVIGDLQPFKKLSRESNELMARALIKEDPDLIAQVGDVSESGGMNFLQARTLKNIQEYASQRPFLAAPGNHDYYTKGKDNFRRLFPYRYPSETELYHSINYKNASLFFLDVHIENREISEQQKQWFEENLKEAASSGNRWLFVFVHDEILSSGSASMNFKLQKWLAPLADTYDVDAVFFGHSHNYEHWLYTYGESGLLYNAEDTPSGNPVHYFCTGGGGAYMRIERYLEREDRIVRSEWIESDGKDRFTLSAQIRKWNSINYIDQQNHPLNGTVSEGKTYFQLPEIESYSGYNNIYGYDYGEKTLHYINLDFSGDNNEVCTISVHYPDGTLLTGPGGLHPQKWILMK